MRCKVTVETNEKGETSVVGQLFESGEIAEPMDLESILAMLEMAYEGIAQLIAHEDTKPQ